MIYLQDFMIFDDLISGVNGNLLEHLEGILDVIKEIKGNEKSKSKRV
jgi:hypothetical protein